MIGLYFILVITLFVGLYIIATHIDWNDLIKTLSQSDMQVIIFKINNYFRKFKFYSFLDLIIHRSNIRIYVKFYNVWFHLMLSILIAFLFYRSHYLLNTTIINFGLGIIGIVIPTTLINFLCFLMDNQIKKSSLVFLNTVNNHLIVTNDIYLALENSIVSLRNPLRIYVIDLVNMKKAKINPKIIFNEFKRKVGTNTILGMFTDQLIMSIDEGNDLSVLISEYIDDIEAIIDDESEFKASEFTTYASLYLMAFVVLIVLKAFYIAYATDPIIYNIYHQVAVLATLFVVFETITKTLKES